MIHAGLAPVPEYMLEKIIEALETTCYENMQNTKKNTIGLGVEFDENSVCNVCQSVSICTIFSFNKPLMSGKQL